MAIDYKPDQNKYENMTPFKTWLMYQINTWGVNNFPFLENDFDQLTNYGMLMKLMKAVNGNITNQNLVEDDMSKLYVAFTELQDYINNYFDNLDVQDEINNKLDDMVEDGVLEQIIEQFLQSSAVWCFNNLAEMKEATNLTNGSFAKILGYYSANDGGEAIYKIRPVTNDDVVDNQYIIAVYDDLLVAELIINKPIDVRCLGIKGDGTLNSNILMNALTKENSYIFKDGEYNFNTLTLENLNSYNLYGDNATIKTNGSFIFNSFNNINIKELNFTENTYNCLKFTNCKNVIVESCNFTNSTTATIRMSRTSGNECKNFKFLHNNFISVSKTNTWGGAIYVDGQGKNGESDTTETLPIEQIEVIGNTFEEVGTGGVNFGGVKDVIVDSNIFKNSYGTQNMLSTYTRESTNLVISNNTFSGCGWECVILNYCNNATISNNYMEDFGYGITLENNTQHVSIVGNTLDGKHGNRTHTGEGMQENTYGIMPNGCSYINIDSNNIKNCYNDIHLISNLYKISINGNNLSSAGTGINYGGTNGSNYDITMSNNQINDSTNGIWFGTHGKIKISNNKINVTGFGIKADQINSDSVITINNNDIVANYGLDMRAIYNIDCHQNITNNTITATTSPLRKYNYNVNIGYISWFNPSVTLDESNIANKFTKSSIINYSHADFTDKPTESASAIGYYMGNAENGVVFIMSDGVWKRKTGGGGSTMVTTSNM